VKAVERVATPEIKATIQRQAVKDESETVLRRVVNEVTG
jgi:hypothetical protein